MEPNQEQRVSIANMARAARYAHHKGSKKAIYMAAGVNPATYDRIENGLSVKDRSLAAVLRVLWPHTDGDWHRIQFHELSVGPDGEDDSYVAAPGARVEDGVGNDAVLRAIEQMRQDMQAMERRLSERMDGLEQSRAESVGGAEGDGAGGQDDPGEDR